MLEGVQRFELKDWHSDYLLSLQQFSLMDLKTRREYMSLCLFFKFVNDICDFPDFPLTHCHFHYPQRIDNCISFVLPFAHSYIYTASLLPSSVVSATALSSFKRSLKS